MYWKPIDDTHAEVSVHFKNTAFDIKTESRITIKDGQVYTVCNMLTGPPRKELRRAFEIGNLLRNMRNHERVHNSDQSNLRDVKEAFELIFHDNLRAKVEGSTIGKAEMKAHVLRDFAAGSKIHFEKIKVLVGGDYIEIVISQENGWRRHQLLTVRDGKVVKITPIDRNIAYLLRVVEEEAAAEEDSGAEVMPRNAYIAPPNNNLVASQ